MLPILLVESQGVPHAERLPIPVMNYLSLSIVLIENLTVTITAVGGGIEMSMPTVFEGDGVTYTIFTDRRAGTVIDVSPSGKTITIQLDKATRIDENGMSESQEYEYERDPDGQILKFTWRKKVNGFKLVGTRARECGSYLTAGRHEYRDYSF